MGNEKNVPCFRSDGESGTVMNSPNGIRGKTQTEKDFDVLRSCQKVDIYNDLLIHECNFIAESVKQSIINFLKTNNVSISGQRLAKLLLAGSWLLRISGRDHGWCVSTGNG